MFKFQLGLQRNLGDSKQEEFLKVRQIKLRFTSTKIGFLKISLNNIERNIKIKVKMLNLKWKILRQNL